MAQMVLIMGESGTGKTTSLRNCNPTITAIVNPVGKPLPFRGKFDTLNNVTDSKKIIEGLAKIMQENPLIIVELSSHTDAIGSDASNFKLSQERAQSCVNYLKSLNISAERLVAKGYGETIAIAPNQNEDGSDNEAGRAKNRRTEFKVLGGL